MSLRSVPKIACCRYFGTMTMWYRQYHRTWLWFCHSRIVVSPSWGLGGSTPGETTSPFTNQRRNGRAFSSLTARGGGLPIGVTRPDVPGGTHGPGARTIRERVDGKGPG